MKKHTIIQYTLFLATYLCAVPMHAQNYIVGSLATPGAATFSAGQDDNGVISLPFGAGTRTIEVETNQKATVSCDVDWCQATLEGTTLKLTYSENEGDDARTALLIVRSKDFHPLTLTIRQEARLAFAVISDTHVGNSLGAGYRVKVSQALKNLTSRGKLDLMAVVGDLTDNGYAEQYTQFVKLFGSSENIVKPVDQFLFMMGNHDNYDGNGKSHYQKGLKKFNEGNDYPFHQYMLIKGYPFISISDFAGANNDLTNISNGTAAYPQASQDSLKNMLKRAVKEAPGKPIFIFTHVPPRWTCYSAWSEYENGEAWAMKVLNPILKGYPQAVVFAGHSHYPLGDPRSIHQGANPDSERMNYYTAINTASTNYSEIHPGAVDAGIHPAGYEYVTEGLILYELPKGDIEIRRYDTYRNVEIDPDHRWVLKAPFDGSKFQYADIRDADDNPNGVTLRDGKPAPVFADDAQLSVEPQAYDAEVTFNQATDNDCVFRYRVRFFKGNAPVKTSYIFSQFYLTTEMPDHLSYSIGGLQPETTYTVEVTAFDSYDNMSEPLKATFTTLADNDPANVVPEPKGWWTFDNPDDLLAGTGVATLKAATKQMGVFTTVDNLSEANITAKDGPAEGNGAVGIPVRSGLMMTSNLGVSSLNTYSFLFDIRLEDTSGYTALYQNDLTDTNDGSFYVNNGRVGLNSNGLGYSGIINPGQWHRVLFVVKDCSVTVYVDGMKYGQSTSANANHWRMSTGALFFMDEDGEEHYIETSEIRFWDVALSDRHAAKLGTVVDAAPEPEPIPEPTGCWTFDNADDLLAGTGVATMQPAKHSQGSVTTFSSLADVNITTTAGPSDSNGALAIPVGSSLLMTTNLGVETLDTYTLLWDIMASDLSTFIPLFQNDLTNTRDGSLFINQNMVGLNGSHQLGYHGSLFNNQWHRIVFVVKQGYGTLYLDGEQIGQSSGTNDERWKLSTGVLFFADNDGEEKPIKTAEIRFWNTALTLPQVQELGATH